ncbi:MAG: phenylalanine--tRNA ligase subunit alpha [Anaerolineaceae bacterium]|nr:phenylalanine--tRNA ligase subunit alpha [Anaerolineaceae bacterium]
MEQVEKVRREFRKRLASATDAAALEAVRIEFLGRSGGKIPELMSHLASLAKELKPAFGKAVNELKQTALGELAAAGERLSVVAEKAAPQVDVTLPGRRPRLGRLHPITRVRNEMVEIFARFGFSVVEGPEIEDEWHNFIALNIPEEHPARDPLDNYYIRDNLLLRTQTSTVQIRVMENTPPPVRVIVPGRVYRPDTVDASHSNMFHQLEGLWVEKGVTFAHLKTVLEMFVHAFFGPETRTRFRPHFFPFTEPSAEVDVSCLLCGAKGCPACKRSGWMEILGCGMVDPNVLAAVGYDPEEVTGLAFGFGIERPAMLKYGINDIRLFFQNDMRFLEQF